MPEAEPLTAAELAAYRELVADELSGDEQAAMRQRDPQKFTAWLQAQLMHVPMPSHQKPDINGFHEGDRVRLTQPFKGEAVSYGVGRTGVFLITDTAPAQIRLARSAPIYEVLVDGPDGRLIGVSAGAIERIPGQFQVTYDGEYVTCRPLKQLTW